MPAQYPTQIVLNDLHYSILSLLPLEGSKLGYHVLGKTVKAVVADLNKPLPPGVPRLRTTEVTAVLKALRSQGYVVALPQSLSTIVKRQNNSALLWQVTETGRSVIPEGWSPPQFNPVS